MRWGFFLFFFSFFLVWCASQPARDNKTAAPPPNAPEQANEKLRLAVLDMEDTTGDIDDESLRQATDYLRILVVQSQRFIVVSDEEKRALIRELRKESHGAQYDENQRVPLGKRVAANAALITTILKLQEDYILKAELIDLAKETIIAGATEKFDPDTFQQAIERVAQAVTEYPGRPERPKTDTALADGALSETENTDDGMRDDTGDTGGVNLLIINIVSSREGREPDPVYQNAAKKRNTSNTDATSASANTSSSAQGSGAPSGSLSPLPSKPIFFRNPLKPIRFRIPEATPHRISGPSSRESLSPAATPIPAPSPASSPAPHRPPHATEAHPVHLDSKGNEILLPGRNVTEGSPPSFKRQEPVPTPQRSESSPVPRPVLTVPKSKSEKKKEENTNEESDGKKEEKKKKPSTETIFVPRR